MRRRRDVSPPRHLLTLAAAALLTVAVTAAGRADTAEDAAELTTDEVVARCVAALGGRDAWAAVDSLRITGRHDSFSVERPFVMLRQRPNLYRFDHSEGTRLVTFAFDGETAWWQRELLVASPGDWPTPAPEPYATVIQAEAQFEIALFHGGEPGYRLEYRGESTLDTDPTLLVEATLPGGTTEQWHLDPVTYLPMARLTTGIYAWTPLEQRMYFMDYREVSGLMMPYRMEIEKGNEHRVLDIERIEVDAALDPVLFRLPLPPGMEALQRLAGTWRVEVESRSLPQLPWLASETTSTIRPGFAGALLEEELTFANAGFPLHLKRLYSWDRFRDRYLIAVFNNSTSHLDVLAGTFADGRLATSDRDTGTPTEVYGRTSFTREVLYDLTPDRFRLDRETSLDGGATWIPMTRLVYTRLAAE